MTAETWIALLIAFGSFSLAHRVLTLFQTGERPLLPPSLVVGAMSVGAAFLLVDIVPPLVVAASSALVLSTLVGMLLELTHPPG